MKGNFHHHHHEKSICYDRNHRLSDSVFDRAFTNIEVLVLTLIFALAEYDLEPTAFDQLPQDGLGYVVVLLAVLAGQVEIEPLGDLRTKPLLGVGVNAVTVVPGDKAAPV